MCKPCVITALLFLAVVLGAFLYLWNEANAATAGEVVINEIAWMGTTESYLNEWIELRNTTNSEIDLTGWRLEAKDGTPEIQLEGSLASNGYFILERTDDNSVPDIAMDQSYTGALSNSGENLELFDDEGNLIDSAGAPDAWPAGDNGTKQTMERRDGGGWQTSADPGGTPKTKNSSTSDFDPEPEEEPEPEPEPESQEEPEPGPREEETSNEEEASQTENLGDEEEVEEQEEPKDSENKENIEEKSEDETEKPEFIKTKDIIISEFMPNPEGSDSENEWIELHNTGEEIHDISSWLLDDIEGGSKPFALPEGTTLLPEEYRTFSIKLTKIALNNNGDSVRLLYPDNTVAYEVDYNDEGNEGESFAFVGGSWMWTDNATPGYENEEPTLETSDKQQETRNTRTTATSTNSNDDSSDEDSHAENEVLTTEQFSAQIASENSKSSGALLSFALGIAVAAAGGAGFYKYRKKFPGN